MKQELKRAIAPKGSFLFHDLLNKAGIINPKDRMELGRTMGKAYKEVMKAKAPTITYKNIFVNCYQNDFLVIANNIINQFKNK